MLLVMNPDQFSNENMVLHEPIKNQIFSDSKFIRIQYSNNIVTTNGLHIKLDIKGASIERKQNKTIVQFNVYNNRNLIEYITQLEDNILSAVTLKDKTPVYNLRETMASGRINLHDASDNFILKISGIWETEQTYGITYKFI